MPSYRTIAHRIMAEYEKAGSDGRPYEITERYSALVHPLDSKIMRYRFGDGSAVINHHGYLAHAIHGHYLKGRCLTDALYYRREGGRSKWTRVPQKQAKRDIPVVITDGGRAEAGLSGRAGDCVCRAFAVATQRPYREVYDLINEIAETMPSASFRRPGYNFAERGVFDDTIRAVSEHFGMEYQQVRKGPFRPEKVPGGRIVVAMRRHAMAVIDGVIHDTYDGSSNGNKHIIGFYYFP